MRKSKKLCKVLIPCPPNINTKKMRTVKRESTSFKLIDQTYSEFVVLIKKK